MWLEGVFDLGGGLGWVWAGVDGSSYDEVVGAFVDGFGWGHDSFLIIFGCVGGTDSWGDEFDVIGDGLAEGFDFEWGTNES